MPEESGTVGTAATPEPSPEGQGSGEGDGAVATGAETVPAERFNGLMSTLSKEKERAKALERELTELRAKAAPAPEPPAPPAGSDGELREIVERATAQTRGVYEMYRASEVERLLQAFPYARPEDIAGDTKDEWEASARAAHEHVKSIVTTEEEKVREAAEDEARKKFGVPLGVGGGGETSPQGDAEAHQERYDEAVKNRDTAEAARLLLLGPAPE